MNRLINETSPYLLQHAHNPVDWYPWGDEAFRAAREADKPVFLSIGYSACHWCHVMERESFENPQIAELLNRDFISIKVDREERPDIDSIYMHAVQMMTGHGGWPMSLFLTPDAAPFFGGTYFPPVETRGMPGFASILEHVVHAYRSRKQEVESVTTEIRDAIRKMLSLGGQSQVVAAADLDTAARQIVSSFDSANGGFGSAPKFPPSMTLEFLLRVSRRTGDRAALEVVTTTLRKMAMGGIFDQVGGGFHRYSVDAKWLVPHFEKMLYDNALLALLYVHAWQFTKDPFFARVAKETLDFVIREMTSPEGGFFSTLDADSEGEEGKFYVWTRGEVMDVLGEEEGRVFCALYDITDRGNFEGQNIPNMPRALDAVAADLGMQVEALVDIAQRGRCKLFGRRAERVRPGLDDKILAGWNGWMLAAFAEAAIAFGSSSYLEVVKKNASFLLEHLVDGTTVKRTFKNGQARIAGVLEDYAGVAWGLLSAFEATQDVRYAKASRDLCTAIIDRFSDRAEGAFWDTPEEHEVLIARPKDLFDNATPSGNSLAILTMQKIAVLFGEEKFSRTSYDTLCSIFPLTLRYPSGFGFVLSAAEFEVQKPKEIAVSGGADAASLLRAVGEEYVPTRVLVTTGVDLPLSRGKSGDAPLAYVCEHYVCQKPTADPDELRKMIVS